MAGSPSPDRSTGIRRLLPLVLVLLLAAAGVAVWESDWMLDRQAMRAGDTELADMAARMPGSAVVQYRFAERSARAGRVDDALAALDRARRDDPDSTRVAALMADLLTRQARFTEAGTVLTDGVKRHPANAELRYALGVYFYRIYARPQSVKELQEAARLAPGDVRVWRTLGEAHLALGRDAEAVNAYTRALRIEPDDPATLQRRSDALIAAGRIDEAEADLRAALRRAPGDTGARFGLAALLGRWRSSASALAEGETILRGLLPEAPGVAEIHRELGRIYGRQNRWPAAVAELQAYTALRPYDTDGLYLYATALRRQGRSVVEALARYRKAKADEERRHNLLLYVQGEPRNVAVRLELARLLAQRGERALATLCYERALRIDPGNRDAQRELSVLRAAREPAQH